MADAPVEFDRRAALDLRQSKITDLLKAVDCEQILLLDRGNIHWLCGAPIAHGICDPAEQPVVIVSAIHRFIVCCNVDSQRLFDVYLDDLGFQLKEWPWHQGRDQLLAELTVNKKLASDRLIEGAKCVADQMKELRLTLDEPAQASLRSLGSDLAHALEASARNISRRSSEREAAGHLGHRLLHRGIEPVVLHVAGDGRLARDPRPGFSMASIENSCTLFALGQRDGLHVAAARTYVYGTPLEAEQRDFDIALQIAAARQAAMNGGATIQDVFQAGQKVANGAALEQAWREHPMGHFVGWLPVEQPLLPDANAKIQPGQGQCWQVRVGTGLMADTFLRTQNDMEMLTGPEDWPTRRFQIDEQVIVVPDMLRRG